MKKYILYGILAVSLIVSAIAGNNYYKKYKINKLSEEATSFALIGNYVSALERYKEISALKEGRNYIRDENPRKTYELEKVATSKALSDYLEILDTQVVPDSVNATIVIKVRNNYNKRIEGSVDIYLLNTKGKIVRTWVGMLPNAGILPGRTATIRTLINKQNFASIKIEGNGLSEADL